MSLERLEVAETKLDLADKRLQIGKVRSAGLETWVIREQDGALNWQRLFAELTATDSKTPAAQPSEPAWRIQLSEAQLADYRIHLTDRVPEQEVALELAPLKLTLRQFDSQAKTPFKVDLDTGIGRQGNLQATGELQLAPLSGRLDEEAAQVPEVLDQNDANPLVAVIQAKSAMNQSQETPLNAGLRFDNEAWVGCMHSDEWKDKLGGFVRKERKS